MSVLADVLSWACLLSGGAFVITGGIGLLRLPDIFTRMHGAGVTDTMGAGLIIVGLALQSESTAVTVKLFLILWFMLFTGPAATHALAKAALHGGVVPVPASEEEGPPSNT